MLEIPIPPPLLPGQLQVWKANLLDWEPFAGLFHKLLSAEELRRFERLKVRSKRDEFLISRGIVRLILGGYLSELPQNIKIHIDPRGKPYLTNTELSFNISHSGENLLCACGLFQHIGVDIQEIYEVSNLNWIIERYFSPKEKEYLTRLPSISKESFFELWSAKEAFLKAVGSGFRSHPQQFSLLPDQDNPSRYTVSIPQYKEQVWVVKTLDVQKGSKAAAAVNGNLLGTLMIPLASENVIK